MKYLSLLIFILIVFMTSCANNESVDNSDISNTEITHSDENAQQNLSENEVKSEKTDATDKSEETNNSTDKTNTENKAKNVNETLSEDEILLLVDELSNRFNYEKHDEIIEKLQNNLEIVKPVLIKNLRNRNNTTSILDTLAEIGDIDCIKILIDELSNEEASKLTKEQQSHCRFIEFSLQRMTGKRIFIETKDFFSHKTEYTPKIKEGYIAWYEENKDYFYMVNAKRSEYFGNRIQVDMEAKLYGIPTKEYRKTHPWIEYAAIKNWTDDNESNTKLKDYCYSVLLKGLTHSFVTNEELNRNIILDLEHAKDERVVDILQRLTYYVNSDSFVAQTLIGVIRDRCDIDSVPYLEQFKDSKNRDYVSEAIDHLQDKAYFGEPVFTQLHLQNPDYKEQLIYRLENTIHEYYPYYIEIAGQLKDDRIVPILKKIMSKKEDDFKHFNNVYCNILFYYAINIYELIKIRTALALVKQGETDYLDYIRGKLDAHDFDVKLAAADALWDIKNKEGFDTLMNILKIRALEQGDENSSPGHARTIKGSNVTIVRTACEILGQMGDPKAIPELKKLLELNLNGVSGDPRVHSGVSWVGRPDAVALAKLGDKSGEEFLMDRLMKSNFQEGTIKDLEKLNKRKYIKNLIPILDSYGERVTAAIAIINLLTVGN